MTLGDSGLSTMFWAGVAGVVFLNIKGFLCLSRCRICHSRMHLLHQIVHVTVLSTDVMAKNTSNSSIMMIFFRLQKRFHCPFLLVFSIDCLIWLTREKYSLGPIRVVVVSFLFLNHLCFQRKGEGASFSFLPLFCFPVFGLEEVLNFQFDKEDKVSRPDSLWVIIDR